MLLAENVAYQALTFALIEFAATAGHYPRSILPSVL